MTTQRRADERRRSHPHELAAALEGARRRVAELEKALATARCDRQGELARAEHAAQARAERAEHEARAWKRLCQQAPARLRDMHFGAAPIHPGDAADSTRAPDLGGQVLAYIGGRTRLAPRLKAVAARHNARLDCHDGGLQEHPALLESVIARAAVVMCPLDCVSHDAALRLKRHCKRQGKPVVWLRSSSSSSFARQLRVLGARSEAVS